MSFRRIFFAVPVPPEIILLQDKLREMNSSLKKIKWTRNHNIHLTIYFIGNMPSEKFDTAIDLAASVISGQKEFSLSFESLFLAPSARPKMLWAKYRKNESFSKLSGAIHRALSEFLPGNKFYYEEPLPHITLARFHSMQNYREIDIGVPGNLSQLPEIKISSCELWETIKEEGRSDYRSVFSFPFNS